MSRQGSHEHSAGELSEVLDVIREEVSPAASVTDVQQPEVKAVASSCAACCECKKIKPLTIEMKEVEKLLKEKEEQLTAEFNERLMNEIDILKERADFILQNEQVRASYMLREAHRERHEKIAALQTQLECKNLAGLMYVMCTERKKSKMEKLAIIEEYTNYIITLQDILAEAQTLILNLSRGYKTAARVDNEWREKMKKTLLEFQIFIHDFMKGTPESDQYFFDFPKLLKTKSPIVDNPNDDPCTCLSDENVVLEEDIGTDEEKPWYERVDSKTRPFIVFGDMADFKPPQRREVLHASKVKTAPAKWKEYVFHDMFVNAECKNADEIKDIYLENVPEPTPTRWEPAAALNNELSGRQSTTFGNDYRRQTTQSVDLRGGMGSILKLITSTIVPQPPVNKALLLGARDSMEIASTTKLKGDKHGKSQARKSDEPTKVVISIGKRRASFFDNAADFIKEDDESRVTTGPGFKTRPSSSNDKDDQDDESNSVLGSVHNDSLTTIGNRRREKDHKIHDEKVCPMEKCQRMQVDSFTRSLPAYMRANPFMHYEQSYDEYEACSPEQLEILCERIAKKKKEEKAEVEVPEVDPLDEWTSIEGVAVQTSDISMSIPECTCRAPNPSTTSSHEGQVFNVEELYPMKQVLNQINRECFFDSTIQFNRFKVIGQDSSETMKQRKDRERLNKKKNRLYEVQKVLKRHPSLLDIFQANAV